MSSGQQQQRRQRLCLDRVEEIEQSFLLVLAFQSSAEGEERLQEGGALESSFQVRKEQEEAGRAAVTLLAVRRVFSAGH